MKKFILLLAILYFANCKGLCGTDIEATSSKVCYDAEVSDKEMQCCYLKGGEVAFCQELPKLKIEEIRKKFPDFANYTIECNYNSSSYLTFAFVLLLSILLF